MNEFYMNVSFEKNKIDTNLTNLVQNDYNSTKINFTFDKEGTKQFKMLFPDKTTAYIDEIVNNEIILSEGLLSQNGFYKIEICIDGSNSRLTNFPTHEFMVRKELINSDEIVEPDDRVPILDNLINNVNQAIDNVEELKDDIDTALENVNQAIEETNNLDIDVNKVDKEATVELTKKDGTTKEVVIKDGVSLQFMWQGTSLGIKTDDMQDYVFVNLQGVQGVPGPQGEPFRIKKTYSSVAEMNADFDNMNVGDYVMIASTVELEDNAKLYTKGDFQWIFITDFSGATGIKGETGATPIIHIGTVTSGSTPSVTISGTAENPVLNFVLVKGDTGNTGPQGETGATGNGIASITKTGTSGLVDTYTITYTDGTTSTFEVTNGQDGEVTQEQLDETNAEVERAKMVYNALPKVTGTGTEVTLNDTAECPMPMSLKPSETSQATSILPDGYTQVDYIEATGLQIINTNYVPTQNTVVEVDFKSNKTADEPYTSLFGVQYSGNEGRFYVLFGSTNNIQVNLPRNALQYASLLEDGNIVYNNTPTTGAYWTNDRAKYVLDIANKIVKVNDRTWDLSSLTGSFVSPANSLRLLTRFNNETGTVDINRSKGLLYGAKIYEGATLLHNYIPCYRNSDNEVGVYDIVEDSFYASSSATPFTYGSVATLPTPDYPQDIHTVSGNNTIEVVGKNLFDLTNSSWSGSGSANMIKIENGIKFNSIASSGLQYAYDTNKNYLAGTYTYSYIASGTSSRMYIRIRKKDDSGWMTSSDTSIPGMSYVSVYNGWYQYFSTLEVEKTFTIPDCLYWNIGLGYNSGVSVPKTITNIQLEKGSQATSYLPYAKYTLPLNLPVENLFDKTNTTILNAYVSDSAISGQDNQARLVIIPVKPNTTYTISKLNRGFDSSHQWMERIAEFSSLPTYSTPFIVRYTNVGMSYTFTTSANTNYIVYDVAYGTSYVSNLQDYIDTIQLEKGTKANVYTPYGTTPIELCKIGDYEDYFYKDSGKWYLHKETEKIIITGEESGWAVSGTSTTPTNRTTVMKNTPYRSANYISSRFIMGSETSNRLVFGSNIWLYISLADEITGIETSDTNTVRLQKIKTWLSNNNVTLCYIPSSATDTEITDTTLISQLETIYNKATSYQDQTNITQVNNDLPFVITATGIKPVVETNLDNYYTKSEVDDAIENAITTTLGGNY